jgi:hypothetical protein
VLLRIPVFRDQDFRIFKPILKKGFESDPDLSDPNPQIPQKRSVTVVTKYAERITPQYSTKNSAEKKDVPKVAQIFEISGDFGCFFSWQQRFESLPKRSGFSFSRKKGPKSRIFESQSLDP